MKPRNEDELENPSIKRTFTLAPQGWLTGCDDDDDVRIRREKGISELQIRYGQNTAEQGQFLPAAP